MILAVESRFNPTGIARQSCHKNVFDIHTQVIPACCAQNNWRVAACWVIQSQDRSILFHWSIGAGIPCLVIVAELLCWITLIHFWRNDLVDILLAGIQVCLINLLEGEACRR